MPVRQWIPICLFAFIAAWPLAALAHTDLRKAEPAEDAVLASPPETVHLVFTSRIEPEFSRIEVTGADGQEVHRGEPTVSENRREVGIALEEGLAAGTYQVSWSVVARDGHRVRGEYRFSVE